MTEPDNILQLPIAQEPLSPLALEAHIGVLKSRLPLLDGDDRVETLRQILRTRGALRERLGVRSVIA